MVRSAVADEHLLSYFHHVAKQNNYSIGLILGQTISSKDYVIHFAKTPSTQPQPDSKEGDAQAPRLKSINDVNEDWIADHARQATRMLPGGMHVLGVFVVSPEDLLNPLNPKIKSILIKIHKHLDLNKYLYGNTDSTEKLILNYCTSTQQYSSKSYDVATSSVKPAEFKFVPKANKWIQLECKYEMDQVYHIGENENDWPLKKHMSILLDNMGDGLKSAVYLYDGELKSGDETIESVGKKKKISRGSKSNNEEHNKPLQVCILQPLEVKDKSKMFHLSESGNQIRIFGRVACKLWLNPKASIGTACDAIRQDIMRSLSTRLEMHWDSLTEEEHAEDMNSVHEPPRRVLINLPHSNIAISDYLFPGEGPQDAQNSLEEMLDIKIHNSSDVVDVEGQADLAEFYNDNLESESEEVLISNQQIQTKKSFYFIALGGAIFVLILSLVIHFSQQPQR